MKAKQLLQDVEIQTEYKVVIYDEKIDARVDVTGLEAFEDREIVYMYCENDVLYIEVYAED